MAVGSEIGQGEGCHHSAETANGNAISKRKKDSGLFAAAANESADVVAVLLRFDEPLLSTFHFLTPLITCGAGFCSWPSRA